MTNPLVVVGLVDVDGVDEHDLEDSDICETIFENMRKPLVRLSLVDVVEVDDIC